MDLKPIGVENPIIKTHFLNQTTSLCKFLESFPYPNSLTLIRTLFRNEDGTLSSSMFLSNVSDIILLGGCDLLNLSGYFTMCKKGANYGLKYLGETLPEDCGLEYIENHIVYISNLIEGK